MRTRLAFVVVLVSVCEVACTPNGAEGDVSPEKGYVTGIVTDTHGQPIRDALVYISSAGPYSNGASVHTDAKGNYRIKMDYGSYRIYASFDKTYAGKVYQIQLKPDKSDSFSVNDSPVIDFDWVLTGKKPLPLQGYFGGYIGLYQGETNIPKNEVEFTFTPSELIDDSPPGRSIVLRPDNASVQYLEDLPLGKYKVKAIHKPADGGVVRPIMLRNKDTKKTSQPNGSIALEFTPESKGFYRANLEFFEP